MLYCCFPHSLEGCAGVKLQHLGKFFSNVQIGPNSNHT